MANVQLENGYFKIALELFEQFFIRDFTLKQLKVLLLLARFSYGFHKKVAIIKPQRMFELAYIYRCDIKEELTYLKQNKVITYNLQFGEIQINKNYDEWKIPYHKLFNEEDLIKLKKLNLECKKTAQIFGNPDEITPEEVCEIQTDLFVNNKQTQAENTDSESDTNTPKYREIIEKDNSTYIYDSNKPQPKRDDPYLGKTQAAFCAEYQKVFNKSCYLNNAQRMALVEISYENPDFIKMLPILISKFSRIRFDFDGKEQKVGLRWLLEDGNWSGVLSGDFDSNIKNPEQEKENDGWTLQ